MNARVPAPTKPTQTMSAPQVRSNFLQRECACGGAAVFDDECEQCRKKKRLGLQARLKLNEPEDTYEQEADQLRGQGPTSGAGRLGEPLLRADVNQRFGYDFSGVPVHAEAMPPLARLGQARNALTGSLGEGAGRIAIEIASAETKGAEGMTVDRRVHLAPGRFDTQSYEGRVRLGHEVAHAIQQERGAGLSSGLAPAHRSALEIEAERAGRAFADGRGFSVMGKAPATAALFRGPAEEQKPEADEELDAAIQEVSDRQAARGAAIERYRKERQDDIRAHLEYREYEVPVDERLRKTPPGQQPHEIWMRVLEKEFPGITREDAEEILRRARMSTWSVESASIAEQVSTRDKIRFRTKFMRLLAEVYQEIGEDRVRASLNVDELLNAGPDMALEIFKDVGRGYYNGIIGFGQGLVDLPAAPVNLYESLTGGEQRHVLDLSDLRADYHTSTGVSLGPNIEMGVQFGLMLAGGKLPAGAGAGTGAAANTASQASRAAGLVSTWTKLNAVSAGVTSVVQAGQAIRDIARGYVIEDGKKRPLTEDDILGRLAGIAFGVHAAKSALRGTPRKSGGGPGSPPEPAVSDLTVERTTPSKIQVSVPGEPGKLVIDDAGWRVVSADGQVLAQGSPDEGALLASKLGEAQAAQPASPATAAAPPSPDTGSGQTAQTPRPAATLSVLQGGNQFSGKPRGLAFDSDSTSRSVRVDVSHPILQNRQPANDVPPTPQAKAMEASAAAARQATDMPKVVSVHGASPAADTVEPAYMGTKVPTSSPAAGSVDLDVQGSALGKPETVPSPPLGSVTETASSSPGVTKAPVPKPVWVQFPDGTFREFDAAEVKGVLKPGTEVQTPNGAAQVVGTTGEYMQRGEKMGETPVPNDPLWVQFPDGTIREFDAAEVKGAPSRGTNVLTPDGVGKVVGLGEPPMGREVKQPIVEPGGRPYRAPALMTADELNQPVELSRTAKEQRRFGGLEPRRLNDIEHKTANTVLDALRDVNSGDKAAMNRLIALRPHDWKGGEFKGWWSVDLFPGDPGTMRIYFRKGADGSFEAIIRQGH